MNKNRELLSNNTSFTEVEVENTPFSDGVAEDEPPAVETTEKDSLIDFKETYQEIYRSRKEQLTEEAYKSALSRIEETPININDDVVYVIHVKSYAREAGIKLSPETIKLYVLLRQSHQLGMSDQPLLAEILYYQRKYDDLEKLVRKHPHIFRKEN